MTIERKTAVMGCDGTEEQVKRALNSLSELVLEHIKDNPNKGALVLTIELKGLDDVTVEQ